MSKAIVKFILDGVETIIQCKTNEKMRTVCQKYSTKVKINLDSLLFLYGGNQVNFDLNFESQLSSLDKKEKEMKILVCKIETNDFYCPQCGEKIKIKNEKIDKFISSIKEIKDTIKGIKINIKNIMQKTEDDSMYIQLKGIKKLLSVVIKDIKNYKEKLTNSFNNFDNLVIKNDIKKQIPKLTNDIKFEHRNTDIYIKKKKIPNKIIDKNNKIKIAIESDSKIKLINCSTNDFAKTLVEKSNDKNQNLTINYKPMTFDKTLEQNGAYNGCVINITDDIYNMGFAYRGYSPIVNIPRDSNCPIKKAIIDYCEKNILLIMMF